MKSIAAFGYEEDGEVATITVAGEVDISNIEHLRALFAKAQLAHRSTVIISLADVTYLDSTTFSSLIKWAKIMRIVVIKPKTAGAQRLFEVVGLQRVVTIFDTIEDAKESALVELPG